jgi:hypothetical protein
MSHRDNLYGSFFAAVPKCNEAVGTKSVSGPGSDASRNLTYVKCMTIIEHEEVDTDASDFEGKTRYDLSILVKDTPFVRYCRIVFEILL